MDPSSAELFAEYQSLYEKDPFAEETIATGERVTLMLKNNRKEQWMKVVSEVDLTRNSKKAWATIRKLTGDPPNPTNPGMVTANQVAHQLLKNGKTQGRLPKLGNSNNTAICPDNDSVCNPFTLTDIVVAIKNLKSGKACGVDDITVEQLKHLGPASIAWLLVLFNYCLQNAQIPKMWRKSKITALLKPGKSPTDPKSYRPISLLCHTFKLFERLLLNRLNPIIDQKLIPDQAGFRPGKSCTGQILNLTEYIEQGYESKKVTGVVFVDLTAAYDTVNIKRLLAKIHTLTNDPCFVKILSELLRNRRFQVHLHNDKSRWRSQKNGLPQGSVLAPMLFNVYTNDQPETSKTKRFLYADDLALAAQTTTFEEAEETLTRALVDLGTYYDANSLKPNPSKTESCVFHLRNRKASRTLNICWRGVPILHSYSPRYLGVSLDRSLTFKKHCRNTRLKVDARNNLIRRLTTSTWGAAPQVLHTTALALCYSAGEYACPVWHRSSHARDVDVALNDTCRAITGCLRPTPLNQLYPLAGVAPPSVRREIVCATEKFKQEFDPRHPMFNTNPSPPNYRLKSRNSFQKSTIPLTERAEDARVLLWKEKHAPPPHFPEPAETLPAGHDLPWTVWKTLNRLRSQVGRCRVNLGRWGMIDPCRVQCDCGAPEQTMLHLLNCPSSPNSCTLADLMSANNNAIDLAVHWSGRI